MNGIGVAPGDGSHWNNVAYPEFKQVDNDEIYQFFESSGVPFGPDKRTVQYGAYDGHMTLLEPMTTRDYLLSKEKSSDSIQQPDKFIKSGYFPNSYEIDFVKGDDYPHVDHGCGPENLLSVQTASCFGGGSRKFHCNTEINH